jgi:hypothetical protein
MVADDVLVRISHEIGRIAKGALEAEYQRAITDLLQGMGLDAHKYHPRKGGIADVFVSDSEPPLLLEIKQSGDWRHVAEAAAQLWCYSEELPPTTRKVAVFGSRVENGALKGMLDRLDISYIDRAE